MPFIHSARNSLRRCKVPFLQTHFTLLPLFVLFILLYEFRDSFFANSWKPMFSSQQKLREHKEELAVYPQTMVIIANYRDTQLCAETLASLFQNASHPERIRVTVYDQISPEQNETTCVSAYCSHVGVDNCRLSQLLWQQIDAKDAKGPTFARYHAEKAITDEEFCLSADSHLVFIQNWDVLLMDQWKSLKNERGILTIYPKPVETLGDSFGESMDQLMCYSSIENDASDSVITNSGAVWDRKKVANAKPRLMSQIAGGFNFGKCHHILTVRSDPYAPYLFHGEEYSRAARLWTHGYDMYAPSIDIAYHYFQKRHAIWESDWSKRYKIHIASNRRIRYMLGLPVTKYDFDMTLIEYFSLGSKRSMEQWKEFSRVDPLASYTNDTHQFNNCRTLEYVPY